MLDLANRDTIFASLPKGGVIAEVGVDWGEHLKDMIRLAEPRLAFGIDCWIEQPVSAYGTDPANTLHDTKYRQCLKWFTTDMRVKIIKEFSVLAADLFPDEYFDLVYIDANHMRAYEDCVAWLPKIKRGMYITGHDWLLDGVEVEFITVKEDMNRFIAERGLDIHITVDEGTNYKSWVIQKP